MHFSQRGVNSVWSFKSRTWTAMYELTASKLGTKTMNILSCKPRLQLTPKLE